MKKAYEEIWVALDENPWRGFVACGDNYIAEFQGPGWDARAKLAAQAPAMARLLLQIHDSAKRNGWGLADDVRAILTAAGVLPEGENGR